MEPILICPEPVPTAKSASKGSSVSPERCDMIVVMPYARARLIVPKVSVIVPIWLALIRTELAASRQWGTPRGDRENLSAILMDPDPCELRLIGPPEVRNRVKCCLTSNYEGSVTFSCGNRPKNHTNVEKSVDYVGVNGKISLY